MTEFQRYITAKILYVRRLPSAATDSTLLNY